MNEQNSVTVFVNQFLGGIDIFLQVCIAIGLDQMKCVLFSVEIIGIDP